MDRRRLLIGSAGVGLGLATWGFNAPVSSAAPIGSGWTEIDPGYTLQQPPDKSRHTLSSSGEHHFWIYDTDPSTFPGQDSGPRSELRFHNDYTSGQAQFEADIKVPTGTFKPCVMQIFGAATQATTFMALAMDDTLNYYDDTSEVLASDIYDTYLHLNVVHDTAAALVHVFVNHTFVSSFQDHGPATHYFKCGLYGRSGMSARCDSYIKNIHIYQKS